MIIELRQFSGEAPSIPDRKLGDGLAARSVNLRYDKGRLDSWKEPLSIQALDANTQSIYKYQGTFIQASSRRSYVKDIIPNDVRERIVYTEEGSYPQIRSGGSFYRLGIPSPTTGSVSVNTAGDQDNPLYVETWYYVFTFVTGWGEEGPPSDPTVGVTVGDGGSVNIQIPTFPAGNYNFDSSARVRIYRSNNGTNSSNFQFLADATANQTGTTIVDSALSSSLQEVLPSANWVGPPNDNSSLHPDGPLRGLISLPNGILAGYAGNSVYLSEPYLPHAWPYKKSVTARIQGLATTTGGAVVLTDIGPFVLVGTQPGSMNLRRIDSDKGCVAEESIVDMGDYAIYAALDGLVAIDAQGVRVLTDGYFTKEDWEALDPSSMRGVRYEDKYLFFYGPYANATGYIFDPAGGKSAFTQLNGLRVERGYNAPDEDKTYLLTRGVDDSWNVHSFAEGANAMTSYWDSKVHELSKHTSFRAARCVAETYPVSVTFWADGQARFTVAFTDNKPRLIPGGFRAREWQFRFHDFTTVESFTVAESMPEIV